MTRESLQHRIRLCFRVATVHLVVRQLDLQVVWPSHDCIHPRQDSSGFALPKQEKNVLIIRQTNTMGT